MEARPPPPPPLRRVAGHRYYAILAEGDDSKSVAIDPADVAGILRKELDAVPPDEPTPAYAWDRGQLTA